MNIAYFDCFSGIAGDMALAALLDCGVPLEELKQGLRALPVNGWEIDAAPVLTSGIHALSARITLNGVSDEDELAAILSHRATHAGRDHPHGNGGHSHDHDTTTTTTTTTKEITITLTSMGTSTMATTRTTMHRTAPTAAPTAAPWRRSAN